jgi:dihydrolipoamide dehydrogenase
VTLDEKQIVSSTGAIALTPVPEKAVGGGRRRDRAGMGSVWAGWAPEGDGGGIPRPRHARHRPGRSPRPSSAFLTKQGFTFIFPPRSPAWRKWDGALKVTVEPAAGGDKQILDADVMLVAIGRIPYTAGLGLQEIGVAMDKRGRVVTDHHYRTNVAGIYAIGDCREGAMLAHKAEDEAVACAEIIAGKAGHVNYDAIPSVVYTFPEVATVGKSEEELKAAGIAYKVGKFPFTANARAKTIAATDGLVKILADAKTDKVLGCAIIGPEAGNLIAEVVLAMEFGASSEDIARTCHSHPTLTEAVRQAAMGVENWTMQM